MTVSYKKVGSVAVIWSVAFLVGGYVLCQAVADVGATKMVELWGITLPAGSLMFAFTFTLRDLLHKRLGKRWAQAAIVASVIFNLVQALYLALMAKLPAPAFYANAEAWGVIFALVPSITFASILAELISELIDTEVYDLWRRKLAHLPQWTRVVASNAVSLPVDSFIFGVMAFTVLPRVFGGDILPISAAWQIVAGQIVWKAIITVLSMPGIYLVKDASIVEDYGL